MIYRVLIVSVIAIFISSCGQNNGSETEQEHEEHKIQYTSYTSDFEVFAEADPLVVGANSNVLAHFTIISNFKALDSAKVTITLSTSNQLTKQTLQAPTRKGIYSFDLKPTVAGTGTITYDIITSKGSYKVLVPDVQVFSTEVEADEAAEKAEISATNSNTFTKEQSWKINFATELPLYEPFGQVIKTTAQVQSAQGDEMMLTAKTNGVVSYTGSNVLEGQQVSNGQSLFAITGSGLADNNSSVKYQEALNNYEKSKADYERQKKLAEDKIVSEKELLFAKNTFENNKAIYDNLRSNFSAKGQRISSPMNGFITHFYVKNGQYVEAGQPIASISQNKNLLLRAEVRQKYAPLLGSITSAVIKTLNDQKAYTLDELNGKIVSYGQNVGNDTYLIPVNIQVENKGAFIQGEFVDIYLKTSTPSPTITIPNLALLEDQGAFFVFVQVTPELFEKREVKTGITDGLRTEIVSGLQPTERVVTKGAILVKLSQASGALDPHAGHVH